MPFFNKQKRAAEAGDRLKDLALRIRQRAGAGSLSELFAAFGNEDRWPTEASLPDRSPPRKAADPDPGPPPQPAEEAVAPAAAEAEAPEPDVAALANELAAFLARMEAQDAEAAGGSDGAKT